MNGFSLSTFANVVWLNRLFPGWPPKGFPDFFRFGATSALRVVIREWPQSHGSRNRHSGSKFAYSTITACHTNETL